MVPAENTATRPRKRIGKYLVTGRIGRGGMGMVYRGYDETLEREVAVKTLTVEGTLDEESRRRFEIEAKAAARLQHPNILTVFELGEERGLPFIAMELLPGMDLETLLRSGEELLLQEQLDILIQVCRGLAYAHEHKIVHRDIKPSNIRLLDDGTVKIMDFGIAKLQGTGVTRSGMMVGTVHYMSPEQIRGQPLDGRSDVFSVGVILYELLAGRRPFSGHGASEVLYKIVHDEPPPLSDASRPSSPRLQQIVDRALCKDPEGRYPGAARMAGELGVVLADITREATLQVAAADVAALNLSRRLLKEDRAEDGVRRLKELAERLPSSLEVRRALRAATRELQRRQRALEPQDDDFPELEATYQSPPTRVAAETASYPPPAATRIDAGAAARGSLAAAAPARSSSAGRLLVIGAGLALAFALAAGLFLMRGSGSTGATAAPPAPIQVRSQPSGARVLLDGQDSGIVTDGELAPPAGASRVLLSFRKPGYREESRSVTLPLARDEAVSVQLAPAAEAVSVTSEPPGAAVSLDGQRRSGVTPLRIELDPSVPHRLTVALDGYATKELRLQPGAVKTELRVALEPSSPLGAVSIASAFPVDVAWKGRVLARGQTSPRVSLPAGRQLLTLTAAAYFLRSSVSVDVRGGAETGIEAPGLGKISIRANPDNCQVLIDGVFVDYPPILDKPIAAGSHTVSFKWPDGSRAEDVAEISRGRIAYVMGRKD